MILIISEGDYYREIWKYSYGDTFTCLAVYSFASKIWLKNGHYTSVVEFMRTYNKKFIEYEFVLDEESLYQQLFLDNL